MTYQVDKEFIKEAYNAACDTWKTKIKEKFPDVFKGITMEDIKDLKSYINYRIESNHISLAIRINNDNIFIDLPTANSGWTFAAWDLAKEICEKFDYYPIHDDSFVTKPYRIKLVKRDR